MTTFWWVALWVYAPVAVVGFVAPIAVGFYRYAERCAGVRPEHDRDLFGHYFHFETLGEDVFNMAPLSLAFLLWPVTLPVLAVHQLWRAWHMRTVARLKTRAGLEAGR